MCIYVCVIYMCACVYICVCVILCNICVCMCVCIHHSGSLEGYSAYAVSLNDVIIYDGVISIFLMKH